MSFQDVITHFVQGTCICGVFDWTVAQAGGTEKTLERLGTTKYEKIYLHPKHHVSYFPGAQTLNLKLLVSTPEGVFLGIQEIGTVDLMSSPF